MWAATLPSLYIAASDCLIRCTGLGASQGAVQGASRLGAVQGRGQWEQECSKGSAGGFTRGELVRGAALSAYRSQHKTGGEVARMEVPVDGVLVHCWWTRHPMNARRWNGDKMTGEET